jgi:hypothetical protein
MTKRKQLDVEFAPGWADEMDLNQEEYDALIDGIKQLVATGEIFENSTPIDELPQEEQQDPYIPVRPKNCPRRNRETTPLHPNTSQRPLTHPEQFVVQSAPNTPIGS